MQRIILFAVLSATLTIQAQDWGLGVRLGDPIGLTAKKYTDGKSLELSIGSANLFYNKGLHDKRLHNWYMAHTLGYKGFDASTNKATIPAGLQVHFLRQKPLSQTTSALQWYFGYGVQFRIQKSSYNFRYKLSSGPEWYYTTGELVTDIDLGGDGVIGLEYLPSNIPVSLFLDMTAFLEAVDDPFIFWIQGGIGLRYKLGE